MADLYERITYLSQTVGPRPAGTEEEQQAALYITESLREDAGLPAVIEDFNCNPDYDLTKGILSGVALVCGILSVLASMLAIPLLLVSIVAAALFIMESLGKPIISQSFAKGASQNVVAKYEPLLAEGVSSRRRKIIVVAHYDSGKIQPELTPLGIKALPIIQWAALAAMVAVPVFILIQMGTAGEAGSPLAVRVLTIIVSLIAVCPLGLTILHKVSNYNNGANCNAAGVSVMMEAASIISRGGAVPFSADGTPIIHDEAAARAAGVVPDGAELVYEASGQGTQDSAADRLKSAKAAIAALTGRPVNDEVSLDLSEEMPGAGSSSAQTEDTYTDASEEGVEVPGDAGAEGAVVLDNQEGSNPAESQEANNAADGGVRETAELGVVAAAAPASIFAVPQQEASPAVPDWFKAAQEKAKRNAAPKEVTVQRSKFATALEAAEKETQTQEEEKESIASATEQRLAQMRESIMEVKAPAFASLREEEPVAEAEMAPTTPQETVEEEAPVSGEVTPSSPSNSSGLNLPTIALEETTSEAKKPSESSPLAATIPDPSSSLSDENITYRAPRRPLSETVPVPDVEAAAAEAERQAAERRAQASQLSAVIPSIQTEEAVAPLPSNRIPDPRASKHARRAMDLPSIAEPAAELAPLEELTKQHAPLDEERGDVNERTRALRAVPSVEGRRASSDYAERVNQAHRTLRETLPSRSGILEPQMQEEEPVEETLSENVAVAGSFAVAGGTGAFAPVGDELIEDVAPEELYIEDADDSDYETSITESGAFSGPGYVEMPKSRMSRIFDRFRHKKQDDIEVTPQQWLDVDEEFDARSVGKARGGWESFQQEDTYEESSYEERSSWDDGDDWGASPDATIRFDASYDEAFADQEDFDYEEPRSRRRSRSSRRYEGGAFSRDQLGRISTRSGEEAPEDIYQEELPQEEDYLADTYERIHEFSAPTVNTEVWFVALGSELAGNGGMKAFLKEHSAEMRGAIVIDVEGLGAGTLSLIEKEGMYLPKASSSRMKRLVRKASQAVGFSVGSATELWKDSAACCAMRHGVQALHIAGIEADKPAYCGQKDDVVENLSPEDLQANTEFLVQLIASI